ncbi:MAG: hypothetical protein AAF623_12470 [Planctomycetota bacterium]
MSLKKVFDQLISPKPNRRSRVSKRKYSQTEFSIASLESRHLLAGIFLDTSNGELTVFGDNGNNVGQVNFVNGNIEARIDNVAVQSFNPGQVNSLVFVGFNGNDTFFNNTAINSSLFGHAGNDELFGGNGNDLIVGDVGNDTLQGNDGNDIIIGFNGSDTIRGGSGNDELFGGDGLNSIFGEGGNDLIFGGNDADNIDGGLGIDKIYALAGNDIIATGGGGIQGTTGDDVLTQADLVLGLEGDDTITGGIGWDVIYGGTGNDRVNGSDTASWIFGQAGDDVLIGGSANDYFTAEGGDDAIVGAGGDDFIFTGTGFDYTEAGEGNDFIDAGANEDRILAGGGVDTVFFDAADSIFKVTANGNRLISRDTRGGLDVEDVIENAENLQYTNTIKPAVSDTTLTLTIQPIIAANTNGTNRSEFFGDEASEQRIKDLVDFTFYEAGIDVVWLTERNWNNNFANVGNSNPRPNSDLDRMVRDGDNAGVGSSNPNVLDMYFVEIVPEFGETSESTANGLAFVGANGIAFHVGDNLVTFESGRETIALIAAHEIAHNLGLSHVNIGNNLMNPLPSQTNLNGGQVSTIRGSQFTA